MVILLSLSKHPEGVQVHAMETVRMVVLVKKSQADFQSWEHGTDFNDGP